MKEKLERRLESLKSEFDLGQKKLAEVETQAVSLRDMLLRISGAIQVLNEELGSAVPPAPAAPPVAALTR